MLNNDYLKALKQLVDLVWRQMWREYDPKLSSLAIMIEPLPISAIDEPREFQRRRSHGRSHPDHCRSHTSTLQLSTWDCCQTHWPPVVPVVTPWHWPHWNGLQYQCQSLNNFHAFQVFWFSSDSIALFSQNMSIALHLITTMLPRWADNWWFVIFCVLLS